ncbi:MAG: hypothetical protein A3J52_03985 [Omnitrophica bacterium RIFCSPHIGHO2_02_FULL_49_9]|nr:MAG: hypothetical protein A3J52_03985 [Omnitrophica bacterium RIFCSPHIGHO2_02_FULL_49_9]
MNRRLLTLHVKSPAQQMFILLEFILLMATMIYLLYLIFATMDGVVRALGNSEQVALSSVVDEINFLLLVRITILFAVVFAAHALFGLFYLQRLTGPLVRIKTILAQIAEGKIPEQESSLRKGDFPLEVYEALQRAIRQVHKWRSGS